MTQETTKSTKRGREQKTVVLSVAADPSLTQKAVSFRLDKNRVVIGSVISSDVRLGGEGVAPLHAVIEAGPSTQGGVTIYDLASDTGVFVNGKKVVKAELSPGDIITIGYTKLKFSLEEAGAVSAKHVLHSAEGKRLYLDPENDIRPLLLDETRPIQEIFDYRPASKPAIEVIMSWNETILSVEHFVTEKTVTVGTTRACDFGIPPTLSSSKFGLISREGESFYLNFDPKMKGVVQQHGTLKSLYAVKDQAPTGTPRVPIDHEDFAKISIGNIDFYVSFTAAPPRLKRSRLLERDPFLFRIMFLSFLFTTLSIVGLLKAKVVPNLDAEQIPDRIATILYQPEKYGYQYKEFKPVEKTKPETPTRDEPPKPKPTPQKTTKIDLTQKKPDETKKIPKEISTGKEAQKQKQQGQKTATAKTGAVQGQSEAKEGAGEKAKGKEGERGVKNAKPFDEKQNKAVRPSAQAGKGAGGGKSQLNDIGNVDFLKGASGRIQNILSSSSGKLGKGGEKLKGFGGFNTLGGGGLALSGSGRGGGGDAESLGGLTDHGKGGGRVGTGMGAAGSGTGIIGGKSRVSIRSGGPEEVVIMGSIDEDAVNAAIERHRDEFRLCYEREINAANPNLAGSVATNFVIGSSGRVTQAGLDSTTLKNVNTERCVVNVIKRIDFPVPRGGGIVQVKKSFKFRPQGRG